MSDNVVRHPHADQIPERLDPAIARMYLQAEDPSLLPDQERRLQRLMRRRRQLISYPFTTSYEEQDPYFGAVTLATLCYGEYGDFKIVNHTDPRISNPPSTRPPQPFNIHLCWANGYEGLSKHHDSQVFKGRDEVLSSGQAGPPPSGQASESSTLQAMVALLVDDWRSALRTLPTRFHAHRGKPRGDADYLGKSGERWKKNVVENGPLPPPDVVAKFLSRPTWVQSGPEELRWEVESQTGHWWCLCLLKCDLPEFGFERPDTASDGGGELWVANNDSAALPQCVSHVILIEPPAGAGSICRVIRRGNAVRYLELHTVMGRRRLSSESDPSYNTLRIRALDTVLDALENAWR